MSHCYILQSFKRYKASLARCNHKKIHNLFFWLPYICTKTYRKFYEPLWKPIFGKQIPNFLCHTVQKALFPNGIKSPNWSQLFYLESDFKSETFKKFCRTCMNILRHLDPLTDWTGPVKCPNLFWTVWQNIFESPITIREIPNKSYHVSFHQLWYYN